VLYAKTLHTPSLHIHTHAQSGGSFGSGDAPNAENWCRKLALQGHTMDVLHCDWSPCDTMLASCSIDNTVRLWLMPWAATAGAAGAGAGADGSYDVMLTPFKVLRGES
jgi:hypothetical protein